MSGVVLRCPSCGTARATPGECEACHEAQVRYYCTNHTPGRWLDASACPQCGARFGGSPARPPAVPAAAGPIRAPVPVPAPKPAPVSAPRPAYPPAGGPTAGDARATRGHRERPPSIEEEAVDTRDPRIAARVARLQEMLRAAARARRMPTGAAPAPESPAAPIGRGVGGCLLRLVLWVALLFLALVIAPFLFGSAALLRMFGLY